MGRLRIVAGLLVMIVTVVGCSSFTPDEKHQQRLTKAAGVTAFRIRCAQDLWKRTGGYKDTWGANYRDPVKARVIDQRSGLITVELPGPQLVDLLKKLKYMERSADSGPLAKRMYDAIAPRIDSVSTKAPASGPIPEVVIDDKAGAPSSSPSATASPSASKSTQ